MSKERLYWKKGFIERKAFWKKALLKYVKFGGHCEIVKFGNNCDISAFIHGSCNSLAFLMALIKQCFLTTTELQPIHNLPLLHKFIRFVHALLVFFSLFFISCFIKSAAHLLPHSPVVSYELGSKRRINDFSSCWQPFRFFFNRFLK